MAEPHLCVDCGQPLAPAEGPLRDCTNPACDMCPIPSESARKRWESLHQEANHERYILVLSAAQRELRSHIVPARADGCSGCDELHAAIENALTEDEAVERMARIVWELFIPKLRGGEDWDLASAAQAEMAHEASRQLLAALLQEANATTESPRARRDRLHHELDEAMQGVRDALKPEAASKETLERRMAAARQMEAEVRQEAASTPCEVCGEPMAWDDPDRVEVDGRVYCSQKHAGKPGQAGDVSSGGDRGH